MTAQAVQTSSQCQCSVAISIGDIGETQKQNNFVGEAITRRLFDNMEANCQMLVYSCLDHKSLSQMLLVSRRCANVAKTDDLWKKLFEKDSLIEKPGDYPKKPNSTWRIHFGQVRVSILNAQREIMEAQRLAERRAACNRAERRGRLAGRFCLTVIEGVLIFGLLSPLIASLPSDSELRTDAGALAYPFASYPFDVLDNIADCCRVRGTCRQRMMTVAKTILLAAPAFVIPSYVLYRGFCPYAADTMGRDANGDLQPGLDMSVAERTTKVGYYLLIAPVIRICKVLFPKQIETAFGTLFRRIRVISLGA